jgi:hypothetical protein
MLCFKFSLLFILLTSYSFAEKFNSEECLKSSFETQIKHEGKFFGLIKNNLKINKKQCLIDISFKNILETTWKIDICREPIHIKVRSKGTESFYKRTKSCERSVGNDFCEYWSDLKENLQDYGLIFAKGERESLSTPHGQTYCSYLLLQKYLDEAVLFSIYEKPGSIFKESKTSQKVKAEVQDSQPQMVKETSTSPVISPTTSPTEEAPQETEEKEEGPKF